MLARRFLARARGVLKPAQRRSFASEKEIRIRLKTIENISKVTKAMNMVAAAKLRKHQQAMESAQNFSAGLDDMFFDAEGSDKPEMLVPVTSDRGLCGGVNTVVAREAKKWIKKKESTKTPWVMYTYGGKAKSGVGKQNYSKLLGGVLDVGAGNPATFGEACEVADAIGSQDFSTGTIIYNKFVNVISYDTTPTTITSEAAFASNAGEQFMAYEVEGDEIGTMGNFYQFLLATKMYGVIHNTQTCEQSSRMTAMDNSSTNADEMYGKLLLQANRIRQAKITKELMEIVSGAAAVEDAA